MYFKTRKNFNETKVNYFEYMTYKILNIDKEIKLLKAILYLVISLF